MIATQDVLHLLWEMEQKALHLWLPERHEPIPGYVLAWQGNPITDAQRNDRGFWSEALLADTRELGEGVHSINWVRLPPEIREDVDVLRYVAQLVVCRYQCGLGRVVRHSAAATRERISISLRTQPLPIAWTGNG